MTEVIQLDLLADPMHPSLEGHFPGYPLMPGVVLLDWVVQALTRHQESRPETPHGVWNIDQAKFLDPVKPGDALALLLTEKTQHRFQFELKRELTVVASGSLSWVQT